MMTIYILVTFGLGLVLKEKKMWVAAQYTHMIPRLKLLLTDLVVGIFFFEVVLTQVRVIHKLYVELE